LPGATRIAHIIVRPTAEDLLLEATGQAYLNEEFKKIGLELSEVEIKPESSLVGETVGDVELGGGFVLVAVKRRDNSVVRKPAPALALEVGDVLMILGHSEALPQIVRRAKPRTAVTYRGARA
jgi:voltage-gated potassium channel